MVSKRSLSYEQTNLPRMSVQARTDISPWEHIRPPAARKLLLAALDSFSTVGYHATTTRDIADRAVMSPAAVYVHYKSKGELLLTISRTGHELALAVYRALELRDYARIDVRLTAAGRIYVIEANPNPWLVEESEFVLAANTSGCRVTGFDVAGNSVTLLVFAAARVSTE